MMRVGVLASGDGSNFQALVETLATEDAARVVHLICNVPGAGVLKRARRLGIFATESDSRQAESREAFDTALCAALLEQGVELVCLAGYMRIVSAPLLRAFPGHVLNVHPSLLPAFPGLHAARQALAHGVRITGVTVHFVDAGLDSGPIIAQSSVPIELGDDERSLLKRLHAAEHHLYPRAVLAVARGTVALRGRGVLMTESIA